MEGREITEYGAIGGDPFPCYSSLWSMYSKKAVKTVFVSIGNSKSAIADLEIAELLGCPLHVVPISEKQTDMWNEVKEILTSRERSENSKYDFSKGVEDKWLLTKNLHMYKTLPWWGNSTLELENGQTLTTRPFLEWASDVCSVSRTENDVRIDILKVDVVNGMECSILGAMLNSGIRPGCILVNWEFNPDVHVPTTLAAGHLQTCGYKLIAKIDKKFFYNFIDQDMYMTCSWEDTLPPNPMVHEILKNYEALKKNTISKNGTNKNFSSSV